MSESQGSEREVNEETLAFLLDYLGGTLEEQELHVEAIATRAGQLFAAGTVLLGLTAAASSELCSSLVGASVVAYLLATVSAFFTMHRPRMRVSRQADGLWRRLCDQSPKDARHSIMDDLSSGYAENRKTLEAVRWRGLGVLVLIGAQALLVGIALFLSLV